MTVDSERGRVPGSFRDPSGHVFQLNGRIFRTVNSPATEAFEFVRGTAFYRRAIDEERLIAADLADDAPADLSVGSEYVLEHPCLPFVSYPYEWSFPALKAAALFHLDFQLDALEDDIALSDASAFNVQFIGARPIFIDTLSLRRYRAGEHWAAHRQFCEQFLNPLLLRAFLGIRHNEWYRGAQEGIGSGELRRITPLRRKLSRNVLTHVVLQDVFQRSAGRSKSLISQTLRQTDLPASSYRKMLTGLRRWISDLQPADTGATVWRDYADSHSYKPDEVVEKQRFVAEFVERTRPECIWDIGCNTGDYSVVALENGASYAVGFDFDQGALELAFARATAGDLRFLPLFIDATNPSPCQG